MADADAAPEEYEALTTDKFDEATEVFKKEGDAYNKVDKPAAFEDGLYVVKKPDAAPAPAAAAAEGADTDAEGVNQEINATLDNLEKLNGKITREAILNVIKDKEIVPSKVDSESKLGDGIGGRRRTKRKGRKGSRKSKKGAKKSKRSAKQSKKGGRSRKSGSKNHRKQSRRRKH